MILNHYYLTQYPNSINSQPRMELHIELVTQQDGTLFLTRARDLQGYIVNLGDVGSQLLTIDGNWASTNHAITYKIHHVNGVAFHITAVSFPIPTLAPPHSIRRIIILEQLLRNVRFPLQFSDFKKRLEVFSFFFFLFYYLFFLFSFFFFLFYLFLFIFSFFFFLFYFFFLFFIFIFYFLFLFFFFYFLFIFYFLFFIFYFLFFIFIFYFLFFIFYFYFLFLFLFFFFFFIFFIFFFFLFLFLRYHQLLLHLLYFPLYNYSIHKISFSFLRVKNEVKILILHQVFIDLPKF
jgi:hypothetical protein